MELTTHADTQVLHKRVYTWVWNPTASGPRKTSSVPAQLAHK